MHPFTITPVSKATAGGQISPETKAGLMEWLPGTAPA
jgi:hypothetical protein